MSTACRRDASERKAEYLDWVAATFGRMSLTPLDGRAWSLNQARLMLGREASAANRYFETVPMTTDTDFMGIRLLKTLLDFGDSGRLAEGAAGRLRSIFIDWEMDPITRVARWKPFHTENHDIMMLTIGMFAEQFRGNAVDEHVRQLCRFLAWRFERGWIEWNSPRYQLHFVNPLLVLVDHAPVPHLRRGAAALLNLMLAERALLSVGGYLGGPFMRGWDRHVVPHDDGSPLQRGPSAYFDNNRYDAFLPTVWLAFGLGEPRFEFGLDPDLEPAGDGYGSARDARLNQDEGMFFATSRAEVHPRIAALAAEAATRPSLIYRGTRTSRWVDDPGWGDAPDVNPIYYYNTPHISMGSIQCLGWSIQTRYNNVMFAADPSKNLRIELIRPEIERDPRRHEVFGELAQHENWLLGRGVVVEDGGIRADRCGSWNLYRVGKGLAAHVEMDGGYHVVQVSDLDRFDDEQAFLAALKMPVRDGFEVRGETIGGDPLCVDLRTMSLAVNGRQREGWSDMLHDSSPMRSVFGSGVVEISTAEGGLTLDHGALMDGL